MSAPQSKPSPVPQSARYEFGKLIGKGGNGAVYAGVDRQTGCPVAIKVLHASLFDNPKLHYRFAQEFRACQLLEHPNIVRAYDIVTDGTTSFVVYELVDGISLGDRVRTQGPFQEATAVRLVAQLVQALEYAHARKVIHRDIKPDNVLLLKDGRVKLTDFGLAKDYNNDQDLTRPATGLGTPAFMAPEQFIGAKYADARCDVYSLAATLYNLLTGRPPFDGKAALAVLTKKERREFIPPGDIVPGLTKSVDLAIRQALEPDPENRPKSCMEFFKRMTTSGVVSRHSMVRHDDRRATIRHAMQIGSSCQVNGDGEPEPDAVIESWPMVIRDISNGGCGFLLARRFEPGAELLVELPPLRLPLRVVRVGASGFGHWLYGGEFLRPLTDDELSKLKAAG